METRPPVGGGVVGGRVSLAVLTGFWLVWCKASIQAPQKGEERRIEFYTNSTLSSRSPMDCESRRLAKQAEVLEVTWACTRPLVSAA